MPLRLYALLCVCAWGEASLQGHAGQCMLCICAAVFEQLCRVMCVFVHVHMGTSASLANSMIG